MGYFMIKSALSSQQYGPWLAILSKEINSLGSVGERRVCPVPSAHMSEGVVQIRLVAQTQGRPYLFYLLLFLILALVLRLAAGEQNQTNLPWNLQRHKLE
jgi:hypothetical protein